MPTLCAAAHFAGIGQSANKGALALGCPSILPSFAQDGDPVIVIRIVTVPIQIRNIEIRFIWSFVGINGGLGGFIVCHERQNNLFGYL